MPIMDLKSRGVAWVGNVCQKFETMCHEVDNIVSQDTIKYVENQVQIASHCVKKFCSDVQDLVPPLIDPVKDEAQAMVQKGNAAVSSYVKSIIGLEEDHQDTQVEQSPVKPADLDDVKNQLLEEAETDLAFPEIAILTIENSDVVAEYNEKKEKSLSDNEKKEKSSSPQVLEIGPTNAFKEDHEYTALEKQSLVEASDSDLVKNQQGDAVSGFHLLNRSTTAEQIDGASTGESSDYPAKMNVIKKKSCMPEDLNLVVPGERESLGASFSNELTDFNQDNACGLLAEDDPAEGILCHILADDSDCISNTSNTWDSPEISFSVLSSKEKKLDIDSHVMHEHDIHTEVVSCGKLINLCGVNSDIANMQLSSSTSAKSVSSENKAAEIGLACSNCAQSFRSIGCSGDFSYMIDDIPENEMENIDLSDRSKLEDSCVLVDNSLLFEVSRRTQKLRSYKKKIRDAFTSKKRLTKEYEQLAIWYGDPDEESSQDTEQRRLSSSTTITFDSDLQTHGMHESEWELL